MGQRLNSESSINGVLKQTATFVLFFFMTLQAEHDMAWMFYLQALYLSVSTSVELAVVSAPFASVIYCGHDRQKKKKQHNNKKLSSDHSALSI